MREFLLTTCNCRFLVRSTDVEASVFIEAAFGGLVDTPRADAEPAAEYRVERGGKSFLVSANEGAPVAFDTSADFLFYIDKDITIALQYLRPDLFFVHGAAVAWKNRAVVLSAPPGTGKSTLTLVALQSGLTYLSDELAPIDLQRITIHPYPRSLYLKSPPPLPHVLPKGVVDHGGRYHVPPTVLPTPAAREPTELNALVFLRRDTDRFEGLRSISPASGAARLIANALNLLAHPADGIDAAVHLSQSVPCFEVDVTDLSAASSAIRAGLSAS